MKQSEVFGKKESKITWVFSPDAVRDLLSELQFMPQVIDVIMKASEELSQNPSQANSFVDLYAEWFVESRLDPAHRNPALWNALAVVAAFPKAIAQHRADGIPFSVTSATLRDLQRGMLDYHNKTGKWGLARLKWLRNHILGIIYEIGRLQFSASCWNFPFRVYRQEHMSVVLANPGFQCSLDGWPEDQARGFAIGDSEKRLQGIPVSLKDGAIHSKLVKLLSDAVLLLDKGMPTINVHIPAGRRLDINECIESIYMARDFYSRTFPDLNAVAFCCESWLLDRELEKVLPSHANILSFGRLFFPLPIPNANDEELIVRVLEASVVPKKETSLQKAVKQHIQSGGKFRTTGGFLLCDRLPPLDEESR